MHWCTLDESCARCSRRSVTPSARQASNNCLRALKSSSQSDVGARSNMCSKSAPEESDGDTVIPPGPAIVLASFGIFLRAAEKKPALKAGLVFSDQRAGRAGRLRASCGTKDLPAPGLENDGC